MGAPGAGLLKPMTLAKQSEEENKQGILLANPKANEERKAEPNKAVHAGSNDKKAKNPNPYSALHRQNPPQRRKIPLRRAFIDVNG